MTNFTPELEKLSRLRTEAAHTHKQLQEAIGSCVGQRVIAVGRPSWATLAFTKANERDRSRLVRLTYGGRLLQAQLEQASDTEEVAQAVSRPEPKYLTDHELLSVRGEEVEIAALPYGSAPPEQAEKAYTTHSYTFRLASLCSLELVTRQ